MVCRFGMLPTLPISSELARLLRSCGLRSTDVIGSFTHSPSGTATADEDKQTSRCELISLDETCLLQMGQAKRSSLTDVEGCTGGKPSDVDGVGVSETVLVEN